jgi:hypothetical protein
MLFECMKPGADEDFWRCAVPARIGDTNTLILDPTDQLFHVCIHGTRPGFPAPIHWIADAMTIMESGPDRIDWDRLVVRARERTLSLRLRGALSYLNDVFSAPVPERVIRELRKERPTLLERMEHRLMSYQAKPYVGTWHRNLHETKARPSLKWLKLFLIYLLLSPGGKLRGLLDHALVMKSRRNLRNWQVPFYLLYLPLMRLFSGGTGTGASRSKYS